MQQSLLLPYPEDSNLRRGSNMVGPTYTCIQCFSFLFRKSYGKSGIQVFQKTGYFWIFLFGWNSNSNEPYLDICIWILFYLKI